MSQLNDVMFPVKEYPAYHEAGTWAKSDDNENLNNTGYKFIVREDTGRVLSCMTNDYKLVTNETVLKYASPIIKKNGGRVKEVKSLNGGTKSIMTWNFPKEKVNIGKNDDLTPEIIIKNSYDGTIGLNILAGAFRLVCSNGAIVGIVAEDYKNKHSVYNVALNDIKSVIKQTIEKTKIIFKDEFPILKDNKISERDIVSFLKLFPLQANEIVTQRLIADKPKTYWDLFNVGTNVLTHNMNRNTESTHNIESSLYNTVKKWALASA